MTRDAFDFRFFDSAISMDMKLYYCGSENCLPNHSVGPLLKDHYKIHYVHGGKGTFSLGNRHYTLTAGQGFLIVPNVTYSYKADERDPWSYSWVAFDGLQCELYLKRAGFSADHPIFECDQNHDARITKCFQEMFLSGKDGVSSDIRLLGLLYCFLAVIIDASSSRNLLKRNDSTKEYYVKQALKYIEIHHSESINIEDLAGELNLNRKYFTRLFKEVVGLSPREYLIRFRMDKACQLMKNQSLRISEISRSVGYPDQLLFSRMFKKIYGLAPSQYRGGIA